MDEWIGWLIVRECIDGWMEVKGLGKLGVKSGGGEHG